MSITTDSISKANRLNQIGFPEFTAKLITDVFNAIVSANIRQTESYLQLVKEMSKTLSTYINDTKESISGTEILNFLCKVAPDKNSETGTLITPNSTETLTTEQATEINTSLAIEGVNMTITVANTTSQIKDLYNPIVDATASRIAADKYSILKEMVKLGMVRLVVNGGEIQTSLNFEVKDSTFYENNSETYNSDEFKFAAEASTGTAVSAWLNASASTSYTKVGASTVQLNNNATSSTAVQIAGSVKLNFSTDYQPLNSSTQ